MYVATMKISPISPLRLSAALLLSAHVVLGGGNGGNGGAPPFTFPFALSDRDAIIAADLFSSRLEILSASVGFEGSIGVDTAAGIGVGDNTALTETDALALGLAWDSVYEALDACPATLEDISGQTRFGGQLAQATMSVWDCDRTPDAFDGFPVCFSWPVLPCSVQREHLLYRRSDGREFHPSCISTVPNDEFNEHHCIVIFDDFINRALPGEDGRLGMESLEIVGDLLFVGPGGRLVSGRGLKRTAPPDETPYLSGGGPVFVGARLSPLTNDGEGSAIRGAANNSGVDLYVKRETSSPNANQADSDSDSDSEYGHYRLRLFYSGGMTPDGVTELRPDQFSEYFSLQFPGDGVNARAIGDENVPTVVTGPSGTTQARVTVLGLADLGLLQEEGYDLCYSEDTDNYIDIALLVEGDVSALDGVSVVAFSKGNGLYNPGGPGPTPFDDVRYSAPAPANQVIDVLFDPDNVHATTFCLKESGGTDDGEIVVSYSVEECEAWKDAGLLRAVPFTTGYDRSCPENLMELVVDIADLETSTMGEVTSGALLPKCLNNHPSIFITAASLFIASFAIIV